MTRSQHTRSDQATQVPQGLEHVPLLPHASVSLGIFLSPGVSDPTFCWSLQDAMIPWEWHGAILAHATEALGALGWKTELITWLHSKKGGRRQQAQDETLTELMFLVGGVGGSALAPMWDHSHEGQCLKPGYRSIHGSMAASPAKITVPQI